MLNRLRNTFRISIIWPDLQDEMGEYTVYFKGKVLNAGAGCRDISSVIDGQLFNQDIDQGLHNKNIHIYSPLHQIPKEDGFFDVVICNAVLEHVASPGEVLDEFFRVLREGGHLYLCVPFMQPEHLDPTDFQRYTIAGLKKVVEDHGFEVVESGGVHSVYHTLAWIAQEWLTSRTTLSYYLLRLILFPILRYQCRHSKTYVHSLASAYRVLAKKP